MKNTKLYLAIVTMVSMIGTVMADGLDDYCGMGGMMYGAYSPGFMVFGWLFSILVLVILVLLIVWLIKQIQKK